jgi:mRNA interferase RelE/StbE
MASFEIRWRRTALKELRQLPGNMIPRVVAAVTELAHNPHPIGSRKLSGSDESYRIRIGDYRVVYELVVAELVVNVVRVRHRRDVYR